MLTDLWRDVLLKVFLERFSPIALKVFSNPQVQALMTQILNLQADMRQNIEAQVKLVARALELVTRDELTSLRAVVKELEAEVERLKEQLEKAEEAKKEETKEPKKEEAKEEEERSGSGGRKRNQSRSKGEAKT